MSGFEHVEYQKASDPTMSGYDGKCITRRDGDDNVQLMSIPSGKKLYLLDSAGRRISEVDEATGKVTRTNYAAGGTGVQDKTMHDSASPAVADVVYESVHAGRNSAGTERDFARVRAFLKNVTPGSEESNYQISIMKAGVLIEDAFEVRVFDDEVKIYVAGVDIAAAPFAAMPYCILTNSGNQSVGNNSHTPLTFDTEGSGDDTEGWHSTVTNTSRVMVDQDGIYRLTGWCQIAANATNERMAYFGIDGNTTTRYGFDRRAGHASINTQFQITDLVRLTSGQYVEMFVYQNSGGSLNSIAGNGGPRFSVQRVAA